MKPFPAPSTGRARTVFSAGAVFLALSGIGASPAAAQDLPPRSVALDAGRATAPAPVHAPIRLPLPASPAARAVALGDGTFLVAAPGALLESGERGVALVRLDASGRTIGDASALFGNRGLGLGAPALAAGDGGALALAALLGDEGRLEISAQFIRAGQPDGPVISLASLDRDDLLAGPVLAGKASTWTLAWLESSGDDAVVHALDLSRADGILRESVAPIGARPVSAALVAGADGAATRISVRQTDESGRARVTFCRFGAIDGLSVSGSIGVEDALDGRLSMSDETLLAAWSGNGQAQLVGLAGARTGERIVHRFADRPLSWAARRDPTGTTTWLASIGSTDDPQGAWPSLEVLALPGEASAPLVLDSRRLPPAARDVFLAVGAEALLVGWSDPADADAGLVVLTLPLPAGHGPDRQAGSPSPNGTSDGWVTLDPGTGAGPTTTACGGDRYVDDTGDDSANDCMNSAAPCATISHAIVEACAGETIFVNEGDYFEDIVLDKQVTIDALGAGVFTTVHGSNTGDVVTVLAEGAVWDGVEVTGAPDYACLHLGSATATELHDVRIANAAFYGCAIGMLIENTGSDLLKGFNRFVGVDVRDNISNGTSDSGIGMLMRGGNGKLEFKSSFARNNENIGTKIESPQGTLTNDTIIITGVRFINNGFAANATDRVGLWVQDATTVRIEGNLVQDHTGNDPASEDAVGMRLENVTGPDFPCNDFINNDVGVEMISGTDDLRVLHDNFAGNQYAALRIGAGSGSQLVVHESLFSGNALAIDHSGDGTLDATHNWWGAADGPASAGGSGDDTQGAIDTANFITRSVAPILVRRPVDSGWSSSVVSCNSTLQLGIDKAVDGDLVLVGEGDYREHVTWDTKLIDIEGIDGGLSCSPSVLDGKQSSGSHLPALTISNVSGVTLSQMTISSAGEGTTCGQNSGDEIGLALDTVSSSTFRNLCLRENGVTEIRVYGDSDNNTFQDIDIDGAIRDHEGNDVCGHRSREGILIDGGPTCEGGPGAVASGNVIDNVTINFVARGVSTHFADGTIVRNSTISASPAPAWDGGSFAAGVLLRLSDDVVVENNSLFAEGTNEGLRIAGRDAASCVTSRTDTARTVVRDNAFRDLPGSGVNLFRGNGDPGAPVQADISCNDFFRNGIGLDSSAPGSGATANLVRNNDFQQNTTGVRNTGVQPLDARENWWNSVSGPGGPGGGTGDPIDGAVTFAPYLTSSAIDDSDNDTVTECEGDCDDTDSTIGPGFAELCDGLDNDCDGSVDEGLPLFTWYLDADNDGFGDPTNTIQVCDTTPPAGYADNPDDCNDGDNKTYPGAPEVLCDGVDQGCDGSADEAPDADADGYDVCFASDPGDSDGLPADCADDDITRHPGLPEASCDGVDNDCDGTVDTPGLVCGDLETSALQFTSASKNAMTWSAAVGANAYALYRGEIAPPRFGGYNHTCLEAELGAASAEDRDTPPLGHAFYYLATGVAIDGPTGHFDDGPLGQDSNGGVRPPAQGLTCGARVFVDPDAAASSGTGLSWADAYTTVRLALDHSRGRRRALTVWMRGTVQDDPITLDGSGFRGLRVLGGFAGTEANAWERDPATNVTTWRTIPAGTLLTLLQESAELDGLTVDAGQLGVRADLDLGELILRRVDARGLSDRLADVRVVGPGDGRLAVEDISHDGSGNGALRAIAESARLAGTIRRSSFSGGADAALRIEARPVGGSATADLRISRITISGGQTGLVLGAHADDAGTTARQISRLTSSLIHGTTGDAVLVEATGNFAQDAAASAVAAPLLTGDTISDAGAAGVRTSASRTDTSASPGAHAVEARPELRDVLLTFHAGGAVEESADDTANALVADPLLERCDLFGNGSLYLDEGSTTLSTIGEVNALGSNVGNWDQDPLYVDRLAADFHLGAGSPAIDRASKDAPGLDTEDRDGSPRIKGSAPDSGAYEATP